MLISHGFREAEVLEMPLDKYYLYMQEASSIELKNRQGFVADVCNAIGGLFGDSKKNPVQEYLDALDPDT